MFLRKMALLRNTEGAADGGGFDMAAAVDSIGADLGFSNTEGGDDGLGGNNGTGGDDDHKSDLHGTPAPTPAPSPAPTPAPTPAPGPSPAPTPAPSPTPAPGPATPPRFTAATAPTTWSQAAAADWAALPPHIREEIAKRENDMFAGIAVYREDAGLGKTIKTQLGPVMRQLQEHKVAPQEFIGNLVNGHLFFSHAQVPAEQKKAAFLELAKDYGIDLGTGQSSQGGSGDDYVDPQVKGLQDQLAQLNSRLERYEGESKRTSEAAATEQAAKLMQDLEAFANDPANPYFYDVADDIAALIRGSGGQLSYKDAYDKAVWANPVTRAKEIARKETEAATKAQEEAARRTAEAEKSRGGRVRTSGHQGSGTAPSGSMDDTMAETLANIRKKEARG